MGTKGRVFGIIGSILGIVLSVFLIFWFRTDPGDIQYLVVVFFLLLPSLLASYAVIKASFSMLLIADIWTIPLLCYLTFFGHGIPKFSLLIPLLYTINLWILKHKREEH
ncbi:hypothetical protein ACTHSJ_33715 [Paenibacillus cellulositrophicus]|uniref:hypothetical protein n=1 Tax=Paenibacillus cellulositrophicus TaxID=562959 RepID=UPI003F82345F